MRGRPILVDNKLKTIKTEDAIEGDDPLRDKQLMFFPRPSDYDPNAIDSYSDLNSDERIIRVAEELQGNVPPLGKGLPAPFQFAVPAGVSPHLQALHNMVHFERHLEQSILDSIDIEKLPPSFSDAWAQLCGEKNASITCIDKLTNKNKFTATLVSLRERIKTNVEMVLCDACGRIDMVACEMCPTCERTIRSCSPTCHAKALVIHQKTHLPKRKRAPKKNANLVAFE